SRFVSHDAYTLNGNGEEDARIANGRVVKEVVSAGAEIVEVKGPSTHGNGKAQVVLLVPLAAQRQEAEALSDRQVKERAGNRVDRRRLIEPAVGSTKHPLDAGNLNGNSDARAAHIFLQ